MSLQDERCPKCFSRLGTWQGDPILTKNGAKFVYDEGSGLLIPESDIEKRFYKGFLRIKAEIIQELQDNRTDAEDEAGIEEINKTQFSKVQSDEYGYWIVNKKHIQELRESTEKILEATGQTKEEYFNYDEEQVERQVPHQMDWIDPILDNWKGRIKDQHIEDLRKFLNFLPKEYFNITPPETYFYRNYTVPSVDGNFLDSKSITEIDTKRLAQSFVFHSGTYEMRYTQGTARYRRTSPPYDYLVINVNSTFSAQILSELKSNHNLYHNCELHLDFTVDGVPNNISNYELWDYGSGDYPQVSGRFGANILGKLSYLIDDQKSPKINNGLKLSLLLTSANSSLTLLWSDGGLPITYTSLASGIIVLDLYNEFIIKNGRAPTSNDKLIEIDITTNILQSTLILGHAGYDPDYGYLSNEVSIHQTFVTNIDNIFFYYA